MEVGPRQDPSRLQRAFRRFRVAIANPGFQTELAINTHVAVSDLGRKVSDIHRTMVKGQGTGSVSDTRTSAVTERPLIVV